jgi:hypothetical protein
MRYFKERKNKMKLQELTPINMRCIFGNCPAIFATEHKTYVLIGRRLTAETSSELSGRIGDDEVAIEVPSELLEHLKDR